MPSRVMIPFAPGFEEMEGIILTDVLRRGGVEVVTVSITNEPIIAARKTIHLADKSLEEVKDEIFDLIVLPGGILGTKNLQNSELLKSIVIRQKEKNKMVAAICAAPNALRSWKVISGDDPFTAFPTSISLAEGGKYLEERIVSHKNIFTSVGPGSAFEFSLFLLEKLEGTERRKKIEGELYLPT